MRIQKKRIRNPVSYLYQFSQGDYLYVCADLSSGGMNKIAQYGLKDDGYARIPKPLKSATIFNANGKWVKNKNLPKEPRNIEHEYHIIDWHGNDHYGTCWQTRMCYQRELIPPLELVFKVENNVLFSPKLINEDYDMNRIQMSINILLEILGFCEIWTEDKSPVVPPVKQEEVPWEILKKGTLDRIKWDEYINEITNERPQQQRTIIKQRHECLWKLNPDFCVLGTQNFWGYVVYGFTFKNLYLFECNQLDNATYVFRGGWE